MHLSITITGDPAQVQELIDRDFLFTLDAEDRDQSDGYHEFVVSGISIVPDEGPGGYTEGTRGGAVYDQDMGR